MKTVDFFIVGAPKCGTTSMYAYLKSHPEVFFPERKEPHFFGSDLEFHDQPKLAFDEYQQLFAAALPHQKLGDASVFYLLSEKAAEEIKAHNPRAIIVVMLRHPVDVMYSFHSQRQFNGTEDIDDFSAALDAESDRRHGKRMPKRIGLRQGLFYRELVNFADQLDRYFDTFGRESVHVILHEEIVRDLPGCYRRLCRFLEIDPTHQPVFDAVNTNKVIRFPWLRDVMRTRPAFLTALVKALLPSARLRKKFRGAAKKINALTQARPPLAPELRARLVDELSPSVIRLEALLGRDLSAWRQHPAPLA